MNNEEIIDLFYCLSETGSQRILVGHTDRAGMEDCFKKLFLSESQLAFVGLLFDPEFVTIFEAYVGPPDIKQVPLSDLRHYHNNPKEWLESLSDSWSSCLTSYVAISAFIRSVIGNLYMEHRPALSVSYLAMEDLEELK